MMVFCADINTTTNEPIRIHVINPSEKIDNYKEYILKHKII